MSRVGKNPVQIPQGVEVAFVDGLLTAKGKLGELTLKTRPEIDVKVEDGRVLVIPRQEDDRFSRAMWGTTRANIANLCQGVCEGFSKEMELVGVGYRAAVQGQRLQLQLAYSHDIYYEIPAGIEIKCDKPTSIVVKGMDKQVVGQVCAEIRAFRPPEPYKGKGVRYSDERVFRKEAKKA